jgi:tRNA(Ile2) C34 agmatinyltransferase TiaS
VTPEDKEKWMVDVRSTLRDAMKMKKQMLKRHLRVAKSLCPECGGTLFATINGPRNHIHFKCQGTCGRSMME